ncbi:hypothetical protein YC2023_053405 [Brassica napus]
MKVILDIFSIMLLGLKTNLVALPTTQCSQNASFPTSFFFRIPSLNQFVEVSVTHVTQATMPKR